MSVDLSTAHVHGSGIIAFRDGERFWCPVIRDYGDGTFGIRIEHGWYIGHTKDGAMVDAGLLVDPETGESEPAPIALGPHARDIVEFIPCDGDDPRRAGLPSSSRP